MNRVWRRVGKLGEAITDGRVILDCRLPDPDLVWTQTERIRAVMCPEQMAAHTERLYELFARRLVLVGADPSSRLTWTTSVSDRLDGTLALRVEAEVPMVNVMHTGSGDGWLGRDPEPVAIAQVRICDPYIEAFLPADLPPGSMVVDQSELIIDRDSRVPIIMRGCRVRGVAVGARWAWQEDQNWTV